MTKDEMTLRVVYETDIEKGKVFDLSLEWLAKTFTSSKKVIEYQDRAAGKIIGNGSISYPMGKAMGTTVSIPWYFTFSIEIKESRYRLVFENYRVGPYKIKYSGLYKEEKEQIEIFHTMAIALAQDLNTYLSQSIGRDDW